MIIGINSKTTTTEEVLGKDQWMKEVEEALMVKHEVRQSMTEWRISVSVEV